MTGNKKVDTYLSFKNTKENGMGVPMPAGRVRVSKLDTADGSLEFIGEDRIDHTPRNETILLKLGSAFDVVGERKQVDFSIDTSAQGDHRGDRGQAAQPQGRAGARSSSRRTCTAGSTGRSSPARHPFEKQDARTIHIPVTVACGQGGRDPVYGEVYVVRQACRLHERRARAYSSLQDAR